MLLDMQTTPFLKISCPDETVYNDPKLREYIDSLFELEIVKKSKKPIESNGRTLCTIKAVEHNYFLQNSNIEKLKTWVLEQALEYSAMFTTKPNIENAFFSNAWANKMFVNSSGAVHTHPNIKDGVVSIFYLNSPTQSSSLVLKIEEQEKKIKVRTGDLIMHSSHIPHYVTKHLNIEPRICIVFEIEYE